LGGGSLNAATLMKYLDKKWRLNWPLAELVKIAKEISSDVAFSLVGELVYETGHGIQGEGKLQKLPSLPPGKIVILCPDFVIPVRKAYQLADEYWGEYARQNYQIGKLVAAIQKQNWDEISKNVHNDFEAPMVQAYSQIETLKKILVENGAVVAMMTGKGPSVWGIFDRDDKIETRLKEKLGQMKVQILSAQLKGQ
jgi:4-diphosphocytidyl-2-C-methyl-D-erythritol kinase